MSTLCDVTVPIATVPRTSWVELLDRDVDVGDGGKGRPGVRQRGLTGGGQPHGATRPVQQRLSEFAFQPLDLGADRGLRDVDALGRAGEVGLLGDGDEILELPQVP